MVQGCGSRSYRLMFAVIAMRGAELPRGRTLLGAGAYGVGQYFLTFALLY